MLRLSLLLVSLLALCTVAGCSGRETNAPNHTIVTGYITTLDDQQIVLDDKWVFDVTHVTLWSLDGHKREQADFSEGMYVQVVASKLPPYETWVRTQPEPVD